MAAKRQMGRAYDAEDLHQHRHADAARIQDRYALPLADQMCPTRTMAVDYRKLMVIARNEEIQDADLLTTPRDDARHW